MVDNKTYEDGVRDGKISSIGRTLDKHTQRLDIHSKRIGQLERISWIILGIIVAIEALPKLRDFIVSFGG